VEKQMASPWEFLDKWAREHVNATVFDDDSTARQLASQCMQAANTAGISAASLVKAAGGDLASFMLDRLNEAADALVSRLSSKDD
jgi:hypothetical protein